MAITRFPLETDQPVVEVTLPPGTHVLELVVEDSAGLRSEPDTVTITIESILPVISGIAVYFRYRGTDRRLTPSWFADICLWLAFVSISCVAVYAVYSHIGKLTASP